MSDSAQPSQQAICTNHQIRLKMSEQTGRLGCPVCEQLDNQSRAGRRRR